MPQQPVEKLHHAETSRDFGILITASPSVFKTGPFGRQPFCRLALLRFGHGARTAPSTRRASQQNDLPLGAPSFSTGCQDYHLYLRREALEFLKTVSRRDRVGIWKFLEYVEANPYTEGDFREKDATDRFLEGVILGKYAIIFWTDHAVSEVKVTDIRFADR